MVLGDNSLATMYNLPHHREHDLDTIRSFMIDHPFAFLTGCNASHEPVATQIPLLVEERKGNLTLCGHVMKHTDHHKAFADNPHVLAIFTGPSTYVSGAWYSNPNTPSTWNYVSVHAKGKLRIIDANKLEPLLQKLSLHFEKDKLESPTVYENLPRSFTSRALELIVGFEIDVDEIHHVVKLSQDRDKESYRNIINELKQQGLDQQYIAHEMEKRFSLQFSDQEQ
ncbi:MAG: FMN-binding negative transcriptional regulator [Bdellovibrionota bacterium]